jgi:hypothetical protein
VTFWGYFFDKDGQANGKAKVRLSIQMTDTNHFTAQGVTDTYDLADQPTENPLAGPATVEGTRIEVELP